VGLWIPSLVFGGVHIWQLLIVPVLALLTTRLALWPWLSDRLHSGKPLATLIGAGILMILSMAGCLWYRAIEVPDVGEPFDVKGFIAGLPTPEQNVAGQLLRAAFGVLAEHKIKVETKLGPYQGEGYWFVRDKIFDQGWPKKDQEIGRWLDQIFQGDWV